MQKSTCERLDPHVVKGDFCDFECDSDGLGPTRSVPVRERDRVIGASHCVLLAVHGQDGKRRVSETRFDAQQDDGRELYRDPMRANMR